MFRTRRVTLDDEEGLDHRLLETASIADFTEAVAEWSAHDVVAHTWQVHPPATGRRPEAPYPNLILTYDFESRDMRVVIYLDVEVDEDPALQESLPALVQPLLRRWSARATIEDDPIQGQWLTVQAVLADELRPVSELVDLGREIAALLEAAREGQITLDAARDLIAGGFAGALVGTREGAWLDVKGAPYRLAEERQAWELAKDVASFANARGGLVFAPATTRLEGGVEVIDEIRTLPRAIVDEIRYRDVIARWVYPVPTGVEVGFVETETGRGHLFISVPPQARDQQPFLVRGAIVQERVALQGVTVPQRDGDRTRYRDIAEIHAALRVRPRDITTEGELLELMRLDGLSSGLLDVLQAVRQAGLTHEVIRGGFRVLLPDRPPLELNQRDLHPKIEALAIHSVLEQLAAYGVQSERSSRGFLVPYRPDQAQPPEAEQDP